MLNTYLNAFNCQVIENNNSENDTSLIFLMKSCLHVKVTLVFTQCYVGQEAIFKDLVREKIVGSEI